MVVAECDNLVAFRASYSAGVTTDWTTQVASRVSAHAGPMEVVG